jgi:hypothetical protein
MEQTQQAEDFAAKIRQLIEMGLEPAAIRQVLAAGREAGSRIADELIAGGTTVVDKVNEMYKAVEKVAKDTGEFGARGFFQAGVDAGQALVDGMVAAIRANEARINNLLEQLVAKLRALEAKNAAAAAAAIAKTVTDSAGRTVAFDDRVLSQAQAQRIVDMDLSNLSSQLRSLNLPSMGGTGGSPMTSMGVVSRGPGDRGAMERTQSSVVINQTNNISQDVDVNRFMNQFDFAIRSVMR